ncbi:MAG: hypothetical protein JST00_16840 [Deltaproteobacteria bacterium]|nr:hypothetical protein [Deltaproteobacteria bacterium]
MQHSMKLSLSMLAAITAIAAVACSSTQTTTTSGEPTEPADSGSTKQDPKGDSGASSSSSGSSGSSSGSSGSSGTPSGDDACGKESTQQACGECCIKNHTKGYQTFVTALLACACGGPGGGDAGAGPCAAACKTTVCAATPSNPDAACNSCLQGTLGASGACNQAVADACQPDADCVAQQSCVSKNCQSKK